MEEDSTLPIITGRVEGRLELSGHGTAEVWYVATVKDTTPEILDYWMRSDFWRSGIASMPPGGRAKFDFSPFIAPTNMNVVATERVTIAKFPYHREHAIMVHLDNGKQNGEIEQVNAGGIVFAQFKVNEVQVYWREHALYVDFAKQFSEWLRQRYGVGMVAPVLSGEVPQVKYKSRPPRAVYDWAEEQELAGVTPKEMLPEFIERYRAEVGYDLDNPFDSLVKALKAKKTKRAAK